MTLPEEQQKERTRARTWTLGAAFCALLGVVLVFADPSSADVRKLLGTHWTAVIGTGLLVLGVFSTVKARTIYSRSHRPDFGNANDDVVLEYAERRERIWYGSYLAWATAHYVLGIVSVSAAAIAAGVTGLNNADMTRWFALTAALSSAINAFVNPQRNADAYIAAWRVLSTATLRFRARDLDWIRSHPS